MKSEVFGEYFPVRLPIDKSKHAASVLAIGNTEAWLVGVGEVPSHDAIRFADLSGLNRQTLARFAPDVVITPAIATEYDCIDVAGRLVDLDYDGALRAYAVNLPKPGMIRREVTAIYPELDFDVVTPERPVAS